MDLNEGSSVVLGSAASNEQEKKEWCKPQLREFFVKELTTTGCHCAGADTTFSS